MKVLKLTEFKISPAEAMLFTRKNEETGEVKAYYNIEHGSFEPGFKLYKCCLDNKYFKPNEGTSTLVLDKDNYILRPFRRDESNNIIRYMITISNLEYIKRDRLVFWEIPNKNYVKVNYELSGDVSVLGEGSVGKERDDFKYESPAPVLEIVGSCVLRWYAIDNQDREFEQVIEYDAGNDTWSIGVVKEIKKEEECVNG